MVKAVDTAACSVLGEGCAPNKVGARKKENKNTAPAKMRLENP
jgi:hypothetical protein